ncbi:MAG TPA: glycosyltransferase [Bacteroidota bacterium]|nr:glycosyltransferase [Bacteroidota bacterium]
MKILMVFPYAPLPPPHDLGGTKRNLPFFRELASRNDVTVLSYGTKSDEALFRAEYEALCTEIIFVNKKRPRIYHALEALWLLGTGRSTFRQLYRRAMQRALNRLGAHIRFDVVYCMTQAFGYFRFFKGTPVVSDAHNVESDIIFRTYQHAHNGFWKLFHYLAYRYGERDEKRNLRRFSAITATTERDAAIFRSWLPEQSISVIQNGVDAIFFSQLDITPEPHSLVFTGLMSYHPNDSGIQYFLDEILPRIIEKVPDTKITIVGKDPSSRLCARRSERVTVTGFVDDVRPFIARASVFIIPLKIGGGVRGKALEAMAMRTPIVTTTIGVEGINLTHEHSALFADTPEKFAAAVVRMFSDDALRFRLASNAFTTVAQENNWHAKGEALEQLLARVAAVRQPVATAAVAV